MANRITTLFDFRESGGLKKIKADIAGVEGGINKAKAGVKGLWGEFKNNRAAQAAVAGIAVAIGKQAVDAASDLQESINAVNVAYGDAADGVVALGERSAESFGMSQRAFNEFAVQFSAFAEQVASQDGRSVVSVVEEMSTRVADFASVYNISLEEAARVTQSTLAGETEAFRRYGGDVSAATIKTYAYRKGIAEVGSELTESQKVLARYGAFMEQTQKTAGDFTNTQDSLANSSRTLSGRVEDLAAKLGQTLIPAAEKAVGLMDDIASETEDAAEQAKKVPGGWEGIKRGLSLVDPLKWINAYNDAWKGLGRTFGIVGDAAKEPSDQIKLVTSLINENTDALVSGAAQSLVSRKNAQEYAEALKQSADESTYNADANEEMGRIQRATTRAVDAATRAQEAFLRSIKFTRDEVGKLKRDIDDRQAWLSLQDAFESTQNTLDDTSASAREQEQAILSLKEEVIAYGEAINLPDRVITQLIAQIDAGGAAQVEALLARWGNGVTLPIRPQVIRTSGNSSVRVDEFGNVKSGNYRASGGPVRAGETYVVGEQGPELLHMGNQSGNVIPNDKIGSGGGTTNVTINVTAPAGSNADEFGRKVWEAIRRESRWRGPI